MNILQLERSTLLAKQGKIVEGISDMEKYIETQGQNYVVCCNIAALQLQCGDYNAAEKYSTKAINMDPYSHIAYFNRFIARFTNKQKMQSWKDLKKALSCLNMIRGFETSNIKLLNKAIFYSDQNSKAHLYRGIYHQKTNSKLAENDYSAAIQYDPFLIEAYQKRALLYRQLKRLKQFQEDCSEYNILKISKQKKNNQIQDDENESEDLNDIDNKIKEGVKQFYQLLKKKENYNIQEKKSQQLPQLNILSGQISKEDQLLLSDRQGSSAHTLQIKKMEPKFRRKGIQDEMNRRFDQIFYDESSKQLNEQIQKIQQQIKAKLKNNSNKKQEKIDKQIDPTKFLQQQLQKAIQDIGRHSKKQQTHQLNSMSQKSFSSILSQPSLLNRQDIQKFNKINIEIVSLQDLQNPYKKQTMKIQLYYAQDVQQTKMQKCQWRQNFMFQIDPDILYIQVKAIKKGGFFEGNIQCAEGSINILQKGNTKCVLSKNNKKLYVLYFKTHLL